MYQKIVELLRIHGYEKIETAMGPCYIKHMGHETKGVWMTFDRHPDGSFVTEDEVWQVKQGIRAQIGGQIPILILLLSEKRQSQFLDEGNQFGELYGPISTMIYQENFSEGSKVLKERKKPSWFQRAGAYKATIFIFFVNAFGFLLSEIYGDTIYHMGACDVYLVKELHEYYRLLTSNYLHFGWDHFFNNMIAFLLLGSALEKIIGSFRYIVLYTGAGVIGSVVSVLYYARVGEYVVSAGASGAIFGIMGALAALLLFCPKERKNLNSSGVFLLIAGSFYHGLQSAATDNAAHVGGCIAGFILAVVLYVLWQGKRE